MAIKVTIHEICEKCGQQAAEQRGDWIHSGGHDCPEGPKGPPFCPPRRHHIRDVIWIPASDETAREAAE